jgi:hypothetical protein
VPESYDTRVAAYDCSTDKEILPAAGDREQAAIFNDSVAADLFIRLGSVAATSANFSIKLARGEYFLLDTGEYAGPAHAVWSAADAGKVRVTELV